MSVTIARFGRFFRRQGRRPRPGAAQRQESNLPSRLSRSYKRFTSRRQLAPLQQLRESSWRVLSPIRHEDDMVAGRAIAPRARARVPWPVSPRPERRRDQLGVPRPARARNAHRVGSARGGASAAAARRAASFARCSSATTSLRCADARAQPRACRDRGRIVRIRLTRHARVFGVRSSALTSRSAHPRSRPARTPRRRAATGQLVPSVGPPSSGHCTVPATRPRATPRTPSHARERAPIRLRRLSRTAPPRPASHREHLAQRVLVYDEPPALGTIRTCWWNGADAGDVGKEFAWSTRDCFEERACCRNARTSSACRRTRCRTSASTRRRGPAPRAQNAAILRRAT